MTLKIGHRGAKAYETENTLVSFRRALALGANSIELDVRISADEQVIVIHDDNLKRVFGSDAPVKQTTLEELRHLTGNRIATLDEALHSLGKNCSKILVELKEAGHEEKVLDIVSSAHFQTRVILTSSIKEVLMRVRQADSNIETGFIYTKPKHPIDTAVKLRAQYLVALYRFVHRRTIAKAHKHNLKVIVWTVNAVEEARRFIAKDVDGIATDRPDIFSGMA
jgi:glycerophosphoryl diester phosphodiesterase